jgi:CDP-glycerol glycerophosphotransferase
VLMRMHSVVSTRRSEDASGRVLDVSDYPDIAELYLAADVLVSDYSSAIYDFAVTGKPIVLFAYDLEHYRDGIRGMYLDYEEWAPGPIVTTLEELAATVTAVTLPGAAARGERYDQFVDRFCPVEDGGATDRVIDQFIEPLL